MIFLKSVTFVILPGFLLRKKINCLILELQNLWKYPNTMLHLKKKESTKQPETIVEDQEELLDHENVPSMQNTSQ